MVSSDRNKVRKGFAFFHGRLMAKVPLMALLVFDECVLLVDSLCMYLIGRVQQHP